MPLESLSTVPPYRTPCGFTFYFVANVGWTDGDMTFSTFAGMVRCCGVL